MLFSTDRNVRARFRTYTWPLLQTRVSVVDNARDLGAQVTFGAVLKSTVWAARVKRAAGVALHISMLPGTVEQRNTWICTK
eukprot:12322639-Alexandrium_andersonii.AAC.1